MFTVQPVDNNAVVVMVERDCFFKPVCTIYAHNAECQGKTYHAVDVAVVVGAVAVVAAVAQHC